MTLSPQERLRELILEMEALLPELQDVDDETLALAEEAREDLNRIVERDEEAGDDHEGVLEKLQDAETGIEAANPTFSSVLRRAIDILAQMGI